MIRLSKCLIAGTLPRDDHEGYWEEAEQENLRPHRNYERGRRRKLIGGCPRHRKEVALFKDCLSKSWPFTCLLTAEQTEIFPGTANCCRRPCCHVSQRYWISPWIRARRGLGRLSSIHGGVQQGLCSELFGNQEKRGNNHHQRQGSGYPLVNVYITMERSTMLLMGNNSLFLWPCSIANC